MSLLDLVRPLPATERAAELRRRAAELHAQADAADAAAELKHRETEARAIVQTQLAQVRDQIAEHEADAHEAALIEARLPALHDAAADVARRIAGVEQERSGALMGADVEAVVRAERELDVLRASAATFAERIAEDEHDLARLRSGDIEELASLRAQETMLAKAVRNGKTALKLVDSVVSGAERARYVANMQRSRQEREHDDLRLLMNPAALANAQASHLISHGIDPRPAAAAR